jgi:single-strand DNA-binding protein
MAGVNKVILVGRLGKDPEVKYLDGGVPVAKFPLATSESFKDKSGNRIEQTEWHNIVLWRQLAEFTEKYIKKADLVYIEGKIRSKTWEDKDGIKRTSVEIVADSINLLGGWKDDSSDSSNINPKPSNDLPF